MLHQTTLISSPSSLYLNACLSSSPSLHSEVLPFCSIQGSSEVVMEKKCRKEEEKSLFLGSGDEGIMERWDVEKFSVNNNNNNEVFDVEDLLDLGDFEDDYNELESLELGEQLECEEKKNSTSCSGFAFDFRPTSLLDDIPLPAPDAAELEWVSIIMDDTFSDIPIPPPPPPTPKGATFTPPTPSVPAPVPVPVRAKRSKRPRSSPPLWSSPLLSDSSSSTITSSSTSSSSSSFLAYSPSVPDAPAPAFAHAKRPKLKKRGRRPKACPAPSEDAPVPSGDRRCSHCGVQKTPQWRAGPLGAKTLCNACGVRFKSGRLLPEYRPACSPTFVSSIHSNSHRKVLEMRRKKEADFVTAAPTVASF